MASGAASQPTLWCAVTAFLWLSRNLEGHQLIEQPRLSSLLILFISGVACYATSFFSLWLPGANGRFDDGMRPDKSFPTSATADLPKKPRRFFLPALVACIIFRLELFHRVTWNIQCSAPGVEAWLPALLAFVEVLRARANRPRGRSIGSSLIDDPDEWGKNTFEVLADQMAEKRLPSIFGGLLLGWGVYLAASQGTRSTFICSGQDHAFMVVSFQWLGLLLDAAITVLLWRILAWTRTTKTRLKTLSQVLWISAFGVSVLFILARLFEQTRPVGYHFRGLDSLYIFDIFIDGFAFSAFFVSAGLLISETGPLHLVNTIAFLSGLLVINSKFRNLGTWETISAARCLSSLLYLCAGLALFNIGWKTRSVMFVRRSWLLSSLAIIALFYTLSAIRKAFPTMEYHPLEQVIYTARVEIGRFAVKAYTSASLPVAVQVYRERHSGRDPFPKFDVWYEFARQRRSIIMDHFAQIEKDILPFWGIPPEKLRADVARVAAQPDVALLKIRAGVPTHNVPPGLAGRAAVMDDLVDLVKSFAQHLPDMDLPINLDDRPRVLAPWDDVHRFSEAGKLKGLSKLLSRRSAPSDGSENGARDAQQMPSLDDAVFQPPSVVASMTDPGGHQTSPLRDAAAIKAFREMTALTCPPGSTGRSGVYWDVRDVCTACIEPQAPDGLFVMYWGRVHDLCSQPDLMFRMHGFHATPPSLQLGSEPGGRLHQFQEVVPLFSRTKSNIYRDILIPLKHRVTATNEQKAAAAAAGDGGEFDEKRRALFWRGKKTIVTGGGPRSKYNHELLHGGHLERLLHLVNNATAADRTTVVESWRDMPSKDERFKYRRMPTAELNAMLSMDIAFGAYEYYDGNTGKQCDYADGACGGKSDANADCYLQEFGPAKPPADGDLAAMLRHQFVMVADTDEGPPPDAADGSGEDLFLRTIRSTSLPFIASVFHQWYAERLMPWHHFVPVDLRWHGLHATLGYFMGIKAEGVTNEEDRGLTSPPARVEKRVAKPSTEEETDAVPKQSIANQPDHYNDARWIADQGKKWAETVIRREDMEIYMFRLLLEWGRLINNARESIGYVVS